MSQFIDGLRQYLEGIGGGVEEASTTSEDFGRHRRYFVRRMDEFYRDDAHARLMLVSWPDARIDRFVAALRPRIMISMTTVEDEVAFLIERAIDLQLHIEVRDLSPVRLGKLLEIIGSLPFISQTAHLIGTERRYAFHLRLARHSQSRVSLTSVGISWLGLPGADALRLLLALEHEQSLGQRDALALSQGEALELLEPVEGLYLEPDGSVWVDRAPGFERLELMGLLFADWNTRIVELTPVGRAVLNDTVSPSSPWRLVAQALLNEERGATLSNLAPAMERAQIRSALETGARDARLLAHEIRNALVPVPIQLDRLYTALRRSHPEFDTAPFQEPIERGITRVFEYVNARLQAAATLDPSNSTFELTALLQTFKDITCAGDLSESVFVQGVRERFAQSVLAELQRNAQLSLRWRMKALGSMARTWRTSLSVASPSATAADTGSLL
jgi:hypothetical protein